MPTHRVEYQDADHLRHSDFDNEDDAQAEAEMLAGMRLRVDPDNENQYATFAPESTVGAPAFSDIKVVTL